MASRKAEREWILPVSTLQKKKREEEHQDINTQQNFCFLLLVRLQCQTVSVWLISHGGSYV
ncbi:mCG1047196 [Mus musculus]|jgi:hypothetical protein|nr:mCG1047196 [Mus musculus]